MNHLGKETSPYLLQHANNPVDWYPWGPEALERSKKESKPIFLSIGYSACHWCHVMEKESFEDAETAKILNEFFISIKVDREERPDLDTIYMGAVQMMTQHGGWPLTVFLTPDLEPFYGGTYFPPEDRMGMPSFKRILTGVASAWKTKRDELNKSAKELVTALKEMTNTASADGETPTLGLLENAIASIRQAYDPEFGGIGSAPKFFHTMDLRVCLREWRRTGAPENLEVVTNTLKAWMNGGIYDHLGGGFHRYSTDREWLVPHFEKMLYDNALVTQVFLEAYQITADPDFSRVAHESLDYVLARMTDPDGAFYSTEDADTEGVEGKYYVWTLPEIEKLLDKETAEIFVKVYNVSREGNWEHHNILHKTGSIEKTAEELGVDVEMIQDAVARGRRKLFAERQTRTAPGKDTKVIVSWNGLMIETMAFAGRVLNDPRYLDAARHAAGFILEHLWDGKKRVLLHTFKDGRARLNGTLDDYASLVNGLVTLYECTLERYWLDCAEEITKTFATQFWDEKSGTFYYTSENHEKLVIRPKESHDGATPSGTSLAITALLRVGKLTENSALTSKAEKCLKSHAKMMQMIPLATGQMLIALSFLLDKPKEIVIAPGKESMEEALQTIYTTFLPNRVIAAIDKKHEDHPLFKGRSAVDGKTTVYVCENFRCLRPVQTMKELKETLDGLS